MTTRQPRELSQMQEQLLKAKRKIRQAKKVVLVVPAEFTFNRDGVKYFDSVLSWFRWDLHDIPVEIVLEAALAPTIKRYHY